MTPHHPAWYCFVACALSLTGVALAQTNAPAWHQKLTLPATILDQFQQGQERVTVIVTLAPNARAQQKTDWNAPASLATLRAANHAAAAAVLKNLAANEHRLRHRFDNHAGFSCEVTVKALEKLARHPHVVAIEPVQELQMHLNQGIPLMNALATRPTYTGTNIAIAICDTGIDYTHPRLGGGGFPNNKVIGGYDYGNNDANPMPVGEAHGTACAGIAAGNLGTVGDYIGGVAPGAKLYALKISPDNSGSATSDAMIAAWDWCVTHKNDDPNNPILVISTSFGGGRYFSACDGVSPGMTAAANNANAAGITVLASSGNDGFCDSMGWPACISSVISVGAMYDAAVGTLGFCVNSASCATKSANGGCSTGWAAFDTTATNKVTSYSNTANFLDVFAPANQCSTLDIVGATGYSSGDYATGFGGTSAACPYAAGAVAALQHAAKALTGNYLTPAQVRSNLNATGNPTTDPKVAITKPRVNLGNAISSISGPLPTAASIQLTGESCVPGNDAADPGEQVLVNLAIANTGGAATANLIATLLVTNGVTAPSAPQSYGIIPSAGGVVTQSFSFTVAGECGATITPTLQLQDGPTNFGTITYSLPLGALGPVTTNNFSSGDINVSITDGATVEVPITVTTTGVVADVNVKIRLNHTWDQDLTISLVHPDGAVVALATEHGGSGDNFGSGATNCTGTSTIFDDSAATAISSGTAPFAGTYRPDGLLSALNGKSTTGTWKLRVTDNYAGDVGAIYCFQLDIASQTRACCSGSVQPDLAITVTNTPNPVSLGSTITYDLTITNLTTALAPSVTVTDVLPASVTFLSASSGCVTGVGNVVICNLGDLAGLAGSNLAILVATTQTGTILATSTVATVTTEANLANNTAIATNHVLIAEPTSTFSVSNTTAITIPATGNSGPAAPYPSTITVGGIINPVNKVTVTLHNLSHGRADNLDVLLVGPTGQMVMLMSDAGDTAALSGVTLTFDMAGGALPTTAISSGTYAPTDYTSGDTFDSPAPAGPYGTDLAVFNGQNPNGTWSLFIMDDAPGNTGSLAGGWQLNIHTSGGESPPSITGQPSSQIVCLNGTAEFSVTATGANLNYQWQKNGANLGGATTNQLIVSPVTATDAADYRCIVANTGGSVTSDVATLTVDFPVLAVSPVSQNVGIIATGLLVQTSFTVSNAGCGLLTGTLDVGGTFTVAGNSTTQMPVEVSTALEGPFTNLIVFTSNGGNSTNSVTGSGAIPPVAAFVASTTNGLAPLEVEFTDLSTGTITNRFWDFGDATTNLLATTITHTFSGTNDVRLIVTGPLGASTSAVVTVIATNLLPTADLAITQSVSTNPVTLGDAVTFSLVISNLGGAAATSVIVTDTLPAGVEFLSASPACVTNGALVICDLGTLASNAATTVSLTVAPQWPGDFWNSATVSASQPDPVPANNSSTLGITVPVDADSDGIPDAWELAHGLDPHDPTDAARDDDGDGFTNWQEFLAGTDPWDAASAFRVLAIVPVNEDVLITWRAGGGTTNVVQGSGGLTNGFADISTPYIIPTGGDVLTNHLHEGGATNWPAHFYRIRLYP